MSEPVYIVVRTIVRVLLRSFFRFEFIGLERLPRRGPVIVAANHISYFDPLCHAYSVDRAGRRPRFFAKAELWRNPVLRFVLANTGQIPVERGSGELGPVEEAAEALGRDQCVVIYPEATITANDDLTPMAGKTGVAWLALASGAPVVPIAVWGSHWVSPKGRRARQRWRRLIMLNVGEPLTFEEMRGRQREAEVRRAVTARVMTELERLVRELHAVYPEGASVPEWKERVA